LKTLNIILSSSLITTAKELNNEIESKQNPSSLSSYGLAAQVLFAEGLWAFLSGKLK
jgi:hypothetical protein